MNTQDIDVLNLEFWLRVIINAFGIGFLIFMLGGAVYIVGELIETYGIAP